MTAEEWNRAGEALKIQYKTVEINADGYNLKLSLTRISEFKLAIMSYINDKFEFKILVEDCEERRRFCYKSTRSLMSAKQKKAFSKWPKRDQKQFLEEHNLTYDNYFPY